MLVDSTGTSTAGVTGAIRQAAGTTGASFRYLLATAQIESGLNPNSKASTSSATGLFQFIDQTWLGTMKDAGASLGYGKYAAAITRTRSGRLFVKDPAMRREIMALRKDPTANALMAGAFTKQNAAVLRGKIGREPTEGELYMAHLLGAGGATKLITAASHNPDTKAANLFPHAARANNPIFYDKQGRARTTSQVYAVLARKLDVARAKTDPTAQAASAVPPIAPAASSAPIAVPPAASVMMPAAAAATPRFLSARGIPQSGGLSATPNAVHSISYPRPSTPIRHSAPTVIAPAPNVVPSVAPTDATDTTGSERNSNVTTVMPVDLSDPPAVPRAASYAPGDGPVFYDLFRSDGRQAVSSVVTELWAAPPRAPAGDAPTVSPAGNASAVAPAGNTSTPIAPAGSPPGAPLDLFNAGHPQRPRVDRRS